MIRSTVSKSRANPMLSTRDSMILATASVIESLEKRSLMSSATLSGGVLSVVLDDGRTNAFTLRNNPSGSQYITNINGKTQTFNKSGLNAIKVEGGNGNDKIDISESVTRSVTVNGDAGNDTIYTGNGNDSISAGDGADDVYARGGNDKVYGGNGNDVIRAGLGNDTVFAEAGDDRIYGDAGNDSLDGGSGRDSLDGGSGTDTGVFGESLVSVEKTSTGNTSGGGSGNAGNGGSTNGQQYNVFDGVTFIGSKPVSQIVPILKDLGIQRVRVGYSTSSYNNRSINKFAVERAAAFKAAGFQTLVYIIGDEADRTPSASAVSGFYSWLVKQPGVKNAFDLWQIGNEPNLDQWFNGGEAKYVSNLLAPASNVLKAQGEKVVGAGPSWDVDAAKNLVNAGYLNYVDYAAFHPYGNSAAQVIERTKGAAAAYGSKPMIVSEWNVKSGGSEANQAQQVAEAREKMKDYAYASYYYSLTVTSSSAGRGGLLYSNNLAKHDPFYSTFKNWKYDEDTHGNLFA